MAPTVRGDKRAFFDVTVNGEPAGRIVFALWNHSCPKTVENFRALCTGELGELFGHHATYQGSIFHRVIKGFMIQGGDITHKNGQGGFSMYGRIFDDENLSLKHNKPYLLSMANRGPDTNGSQFFITCQEAPHLDGKHVVFGEVIKGVDVVQRIENLATGEEDKPVDKVQIRYCGEMVRKGAGGGAKEAEAAENEPSGVKMDDEPTTNNWLRRRSKSPEDRKKEKKSRERSLDNRRRGPSRADRNTRDHRRSRSRSHSRDRNAGRDERRDGKRLSITTKDGVKVRGRGKITFLGTRPRSTTPPHWKREESKKLSLEEHHKRQEELEDREKRRAAREKEDAERRERLDKERMEREAQRELDRQKRDAEKEFERQAEERHVESEVKKEDSSSSSKSTSSESSTSSSDSDSD